jgi:hypothetical protein
VDQNHTQERKKGVFPSTQCQPNFNFHYELMGSKKIGEGQHSIFPFQASLLHLHDIFHVVIWDLSNSMRLFYMAGWLAGWLASSTCVFGWRSTAKRSMEK